MTHQQAVTSFASERYLLNEMSEVERNGFEEHYFACIECAEDVRSGALMQEGAKAGFLKSGAGEVVAGGRRAEVVPIRSRRAWYQTAIVPWAVAATLAVVVGYQSLGRMPAAGQGEPQALAPISLRPATRGQEPIVPVGAGAASVALVVDAISAVGTEVIYDLRDAEGSGIVSGRAQAPALGSPLLLLIPARAVSRPGRYVLTVAGTEYPFAVVAP